MTELETMSVRDLLAELSEIEDRLREQHATPGAPLNLKLSIRGRQIQYELERRRNRP